MTIRKWLHLMWTTVLIGTGAAFVTGLLLISIFKDFTIVEVQQPGFNLSTITFIAISGALFGMLSLTGFFSYMIVRYIALGIFRSKWVWDVLQVCIIIIAYVDFIYLRYVNASSGRSWLEFTVLPTLLLFVSLFVSYIKVKATHRSAFLPTLLFMFVATILEAIPATRSDNDASVLFMIIPLVICNAWQILRFHKLVANQKELSA